MKRNISGGAHNLIRSLKRLRRGIAAILFLSLICLNTLCALDFSAFSRRADSSWRKLEQAKVLYERQEYGDALNAIFDAVELRKAEASGAALILRSVLDSRHFRRIGDDIQRVVAELEERGNTEAIAVLNEVFIQHDAAYFNNSMENLLLWLDGYAVYPEALFWEGLIYCAEGEFTLAEQYYLKAWENSAYFDIPDERYIALYALADLSAFRNEAEKREKYLLLIVADDPLFSVLKDPEDKYNPTFAAMRLNLTSQSSTESFFRLYRHDAWFALSAYQQLTAYYYQNQSVDRAFNCSILASSILFARLVQSLNEREVFNQYGSFDSVLTGIKRHDDLVDWAEKNNIWETFYYLGIILNELGNAESALALFADCAKTCGDELWLAKFLNKISG